MILKVPYSRYMYSVTHYSMILSITIYNPELKHSAYLPESILTLAEESHKFPFVQDMEMK